MHVLYFPLSMFVPSAFPLTPSSLLFTPRREAGTSSSISNERNPKDKTEILSGQGRSEEASRSSALCVRNRERGHPGGRR